MEYNGQQMIRIEAYDMDNEDEINDLTQQELIGTVEFNLASIVTSEGKRKQLLMKEAK